MKAFISYSHQDSAALTRLHVHLAMLRRDGLIDEWFDREIFAGGNIESEITEQLETSDLFLLLVSPDFLASDYCFNRELTRALERNRAGAAWVVPIIIEPCEWTSSSLRELKALPRDGKPVSEWTNANNAYLDVARELRRLLEAGPAARPNSAIESLSAEPQATERRYRLKRDFDEIDRSEFRDKAFEALRVYFERAIAEIDSIDDLRGRFVALSPTSFGCTIVNRARDRGTAHLTVHTRASGMGMGDIFYSFSENAPPNAANGGFNILADEFELYLAGSTFGFTGEKERLTPEAAAERLWAEFLQQAGVSYD